MFTRAGLGTAARVTAGADALGWELFTEIERGFEALVLTRSNVLVSGSNVPLKVAVRLLCRPAAGKVVLRAPTP